MIADGCYTLVYKTGDYRTVRVKTYTAGPLEGKTVLKLKQGHHFFGCAFISDNKLNFWHKFKDANPPERIARITRAFDRIVTDPAAAGFAFAMKESRCCRCGRELSVPASIHNGRGPECAKKSWTRDDQVEAYNARATKQDTRRVPKHETEDFNERWARYKNEFAEQERRQEEMAFESDPDFQSGRRG